MFVFAINSIGKSHFTFFNFRTLYVVTYKMRSGIRTLFRTLYVDRFRVFALRMSVRPTHRLARHSAGLRKDDGPDDGSAQTPRRRARRQNRTGYWRSVSCREVFNLRFTCMYYTVYYQRYSLLKVCITKFISHEQKCNILRHADSIQNRQKLSSQND